MKILFLTIGRFDDIEAPGIYPDLLRYFRNQGHEVYIVTPRQRREKLPTELLKRKGSYILSVKVGNITKCGMVEKGISTLTIEKQYKKAIKKYFSDVRFDLVLYSTPPITLLGAIKYVKKRDGAKTYLLLKDIFPQNAVDLGMMSKTGLKAPLYKVFRKKEKKLYAISDHIGCMSQANVDYVINHNVEVKTEVVHICPNSIEVMDKRLNCDMRNAMREKYNIPLDKKVFVYGGSLGKPQGIPFLIKCLEKCKDLDEAFFLIVGDGTEYGKLEEYFNNSRQSNMKLMKRLPKEDYDRMVATCDVGMIFLDHRFTIPNFPSRLLAYMQAGIPVLACTDLNTDVGQVLVDGGFGWWCESNDAKNFRKKVEEVCCADIKIMGKRGYCYLEEYYSVSGSYDTIMKCLKYNSAIGKL